MNTNCFSTMTREVHKDLSTVFRPGQKVWVMLDNKPFEVIIKAVRFELVQTDSEMDDRNGICTLEVLHYKCWVPATQGRVVGVFKEIKEVYETKGALLDSL
jgi:hypothetical protein